MRAASSDPGGTDGEDIRIVLMSEREMFPVVLQLVDSFVICRIDSYTLFDNGLESNRDIDIVSDGLEFWKSTKYKLIFLQEAESNAGADTTTPNGTATGS